MNIRDPQARFADVVPTDVRPQTTVEHEVNRSGKFTANLSELAGELEASHTKMFKTYTCHVKGVGIGGSRATWRLEEDPDTQSGFGANNPLFVSVIGEGPFEALVQMRCALRSEGFKGIGEGLIELILGKSLEPGRQHRVTIHSPEAPPSSRWIRWLAS